ncbi:lysosomal alpha-glucosidase-like isoform X2 [Liolophura sinensis]|uniref:lysosomal alpha-glucosidase-like isoform X2 n=1 Tax=Liolophura sinensis TaxID=3198878 RepID=UPI0031582006
MDNQQGDIRRRGEVQQYLANERLNETVRGEDDPPEIDIDEIMNQPRQPHLLEKLSYWLVLITIVLSIVNYSGPYLVYLKMAYGFHSDDLIFEPQKGENVDGINGVPGSVKDLSDINSDSNVYAMDAGSDSVQQPVASQYCDDIVDGRKFDCHPENNPTLAKCHARGCCWKPVATREKPTSYPDPFTTQAPVDIPFCYYPRKYAGYQITHLENTKNGLQATLSRETKSYYPGDITTLRMDIMFEAKERLRMKIYDPSLHRFEVPLATPRVSSKPASVDYDVILPASGDPFGVVVKRKSTGTVLLNTTGAFMFADQFIQLSYYLPSSYIYGLGEHRDSLLHSVNWTRFTMWTRDRKPKEGDNLYGDHPFYLVMEEDGQSHGVFLLNSNAMDVVLQPAPALTWRTIGGVIDLYMFLGPTPEGVIQQYTDVIGRPFMPPYWSLGFHQCRWGYTTVQETLDVVDRMKAYGIPQDVQWNDIDYARDMLDFTTGIDTFGDQGAMVEDLHRRGLHYIMIVDPAISVNQTPGSYPPYDVGLQMDIFVKDSQGRPLKGQMWPGVTVWPDFSNPQTHSYWTAMVQQFHSTVKFDGMWIDMNEPVNFVNGATEGCPSQSSIENPPYVPAVRGGTLRSYTLCATAQQHWGLHYNVHSLYGLTETNATYSALKTVRGKRPFIISRSTFPGQGHYGGHWNGDNNSTFYDMYKSISAVLNMNLFGIPMVGSDICGFRGNATAELCRRWQQLGAFYPFARNHNNKFNRAQDPASFGDSVAASSRRALETRYSLLPCLYTLFHHSHVTGTTVARPLFFEFSEDKSTYNNDRQFLWGSSLLISPVLQQNHISVDGYFPKGVWYNLHTGQKLVSAGQTVTLDAPLDVINVHVRAGFILPTQQPALSTTKSRKNLVEVRVYLDSDGQASGDMFWDDGDSLDTYETGVYTFLRFTTKDGIFVSEPKKAGYPSMPPLGSVAVHGVPKQPITVTFNGSPHQFVYNHQMLYVENLAGDLLTKLTLTWK